MNFLYMPMEIASRELDSRLLITLFANKAGLEVIIGQKWLLQKNARWMPKGFWIFKTLTPGDAKAMHRIKKLGHRIGAIDEEMPGLGEGCKRLRWVDKRSVEASEAIFCLGDQHVSSMIDTYPNHQEKLHITGNPRWDFLRPELRQLYADDAAKIRSEHGRIILINTNIGLVNSAKNTAAGLIRALSRDGRINLKIEEDRKFVNDLQSFEEANFSAAPHLARRLAIEFPEHTIVLRPHPTEKIEPYLQKLQGLPRIKIIREGPAAAWLSASEVLVHTSCTTATEAFALGQPAICFETSPSSMHSYFLSSALSVSAKSEDEVIEAAREIISGGDSNLSNKDTRKVFEKFFAAQSGPLAAERIANFVANSFGTNSPKEPSDWKPGFMFRRKWRPSKFQKRIFPPIENSDVEARLQTLTSMLDEVSMPKVHKIGDGQFHIHP